VQYRHLPRLLQQEGDRFYQVDKRWRPKEIIPPIISGNILKDAVAKYRDLREAEDELQTLERAHVYIRILNRMQLALRRAQFAWRSDDLVLVTAIAEFYSDYGTVLQNLKIDEGRGRFANHEDGSVR